MWTGNLRVAFLATAAIGVVLAGASSDASGRGKTTRDYCNELANKLQSANLDAQSRGFYSVTQPIFYVGDSNGTSSEAQAKILSDQKIAAYQNWLDHENSVIQSYRGRVNADGCASFQDAQATIKGGYATLADLKAFTGPYTQAVAALGSSPAAQASQVFLSLPCRSAGSSVNGLRPCGEVIRDVTSWTLGYIQKMTDAIYRGCDLKDLSVTSDPSTCKPTSKVETCNFFAGLNAPAITGSSSGAAAPAELTTNHLGRSCGNWISVNPHVSGRSCMIDATQMGAREQAYYQGNMIRSFDCHWAQVKNEIASGKLRLTAAAGLSPERKYSTQIKQVKDAQSLLAAYKNVTAIENCADPSNASAGEQSACMMKTHRLILEQHLAHLAAVEVIERARRSFERFDAGSASRGFFNEFKNYLQQNAGQCVGKSSDCSPGTYLSGCYIKLWNQFFVSRSNSVWSSEVCQ